MQSARDLKELQKLSSENPAKKRRVTAGEDPEVEEYKVKHLEAFTEIGMKWPPDLPPDLSHLPLRMQEIVYFHVQRNEKQKLNNNVVIDLNMNIDFKADMEDGVPCITSHSKMFHMKHMREIWGAELLMIQGWPFEQLSFDEFSHAEMTDLAGNSFNSMAIAPLIVALITHCPLVMSDVFIAVPSSTESEIDDGYEEEEEEEAPSELSDIDGIDTLLQ